jgi:hypothetical protein
MSDDLLRLLTRGDWACAFGEGAALATVCRELDEIVEPGLATELANRAAAGTIDASTRRRWIELASDLRRHARSAAAAARGYA